MEMKAGDLDFFRKKLGTLRFGFSGPKFSNKGEVAYLEKEGAIWVEGAKCLEGQDKCDWDNKVVMKLGRMDIAALVTGFRLTKTGKVAELVHKTESGTSSMIAEHTDREGSFKFTIFNTRGEEKRNFSIYLDTREVYQVVTCLEYALPKMLNW